MAHGCRVSATYAVLDMSFNCNANLAFLLNHPMQRVPYIVIRLMTEEDLSWVIRQWRVLFLESLAHFDPLLS